MCNVIILRYQRAICTLLALLFALFLILNPVMGTYLASAKEKEKTLTILFTHDMHDNVYPFQAVENNKVVRLGGYARLKTAINEQKKADPEALLVDGGDFSMGTPFQTIFQSDAPELRLLGAIGYDVTTLGNHEFDYRPDGLTGSLQAAMKSKDSLPAIVQSNIEFPLDQDGKLTDSLKDLKHAMEKYSVRDYVVFERNGVKIGVFGVMGEESESMAPMSEVSFSDEITQAKRVVQALKEKEKVDFILCLSHSGTKKNTKESEDEILAKEVPEIDMIISGHTHTALLEPIVVGTTIIGSVGYYGKYLGSAKMIQNDEGGWKLKQYQLIPIDDSFAEDRLISDLASKYKDVVQKKYFDKFGMGYDEIIATSDYQFETPSELTATHGEAIIGNLIGDAYLYSVKKAEGKKYVPVTAAIVPKGTIRDTIFQGEVTTANAFSISSLGIGADGLPGYPLISVYLTGKELKTACEVDASITPLMNQAQLYISGINFKLNPNRLIFNKVVETELVNEDGSTEEIQDDKLYRIVCNLYSAQMLSVVGDKSYGLMSLVPKDQEGKVIEHFEDFIIYRSTQNGKSELKEWYAVVQYLKSFDRVNDVPKIPAYYSEKHGRKVIMDDTMLTAILSNPNQIGIAVDIIVAVLLLTVILMIYRIATRKKKRKSRRNKLRYQGNRKRTGNNKKRRNT